jgi:glutamine cyclotransferase
MHLIATALLAATLVLGSMPAVAAEPVALIDWEEVSRRPHDTAAFTQGLLLDGSGRLFESTGLRGRSSVREVDPATGEVLRTKRLRDGLFAEGLALVGDELVQLTWQAGRALRRDVETFERLGTHRYAGEGWGLCHDGERLVMSDGSDRLTFRDAQTFEVLSSVSVTLEAQPIDMLNELECVAGSVWANVWLTDAIVRIDPEDGRISGVLDLRGLIDPHPSETRAGAVLNGIAYDATRDTFLVTGKLWPEVIEIRLLEVADEGAQAAGEAETADS